MNFPACHDKNCVENEGRSARDRKAEKVVMFGIMGDGRNLYNPSYLELTLDISVTNYLVLQASHPLLFRLIIKRGAASAEVHDSVLPD